MNVIDVVHEYLACVDCASHKSECLFISFNSLVDAFVVHTDSVKRSRMYLIQKVALYKSC